LNFFGYAGSFEESAKGDEDKASGGKNGSVSVGGEGVKVMDVHGGHPDEDIDEHEDQESDDEEDLEVTGFFYASAVEEGEEGAKGNADDSDVDV